MQIEVIQPTHQARRSVRSSETVSRLFTISAGAILFAVAAGKVLIVLTSAPPLSTNDPILGLPTRVVLSAALTIEFILAASCLLAPHIKTYNLYAIAYFASVVTLYRAALWLIGWERLCNCLGLWTELFGISDAAGERIAIAVLSYLLIGSCLGLLQMDK